jgi:predicted nucleic acid-binding protein
VGGDVEVFLDTSVLFSAVHSEIGGARMILKLGEAGAVSLWMGPGVLREAEAVLARKSPKSKAYFALLIDRVRIHVGEEAGADMLERALAVVDHQRDAEVLAEAMVIGVDYFVSLDRRHLVGNPRAAQLPFPIGTPGDFLEWSRERLIKHG